MYKGTFGLQKNEILKKDFYRTGGINEIQKFLIEKGDSLTSLDLSDNYFGDKDFSLLFSQKKDDNNKKSKDVTFQPVVLRNLQKIKLLRNSLTKSSLSLLTNFVLNSASKLSSLNISYNELFTAKSQFVSFLSPFNLSQKQDVFKKNLKVLSLERTNFSKNAVDQLRSFLSDNVSLRYLNLKYNDLSGDSLSKLFRMCEEEREGKRPKNFGSFLEVLNLSSCKIPTSSLKPLLNFINYQQKGNEGKGGLKNLNLSFNPLGDEGMKILFGSKSKILTQIETLWFSSCGITAKGVKTICNFWNKNSSLQLREFHIGGNEIKNLGLKTFLSSFVKNSILIQKLSLWNTKINEEGMTELSLFLAANSKLKEKQLKYLDISSNNVGDIGLQMLLRGGLKGNKVLRELVLVYTKISEKSVPDLCDFIACNESLIYLNVDGNALFNNGLKMLIEKGIMRNNDTLIELSFGNIQITKDVFPLLNDLVEKKRSLIAIDIEDNYEFEEKKVLMFENKMKAKNGKEFGALVKSIIDNNVKEFSKILDEKTFNVNMLFMNENKSNFLHYIIECKRIEIFEAFIKCLENCKKGNDKEKEKSKKMHNSISYCLREENKENITPHQLFTYHKSDWKDCKQKKYFQTF